MKKFSYKFSKFGLVVLIIGLVSAALCATLNIIRLINLLQSDIAATKDFASTGLSIAIGLAGIIIIIPVLASSAYELDNNNLATRMGIIKTKIKMSAITRVTLFKTSSKLVVFYNQSDYVAINIAPESFDEFIDALKSYNKKILYAIDYDKDDVDHL